MYLMAKKLLLLFLFLLSAGRLPAQFSKIYYPHINRAELAITREMYAEASAAYQEAFANVKYPLALDLYNAIACCIMLHNFEGAKPLLLKMAAKGIPAETFDKEDLLQKVYSQWQAFKPVYRQIQETFETSLPDSVHTWLQKWQDSHTNFPKRFIYSYGEKNTESFHFNPAEDIEARMNMEAHLSDTGGYSENQEGLLSGDYLLTQTNALIFSRYLGPVMLRQSDSLLLKNVAELLKYTPRINGTNYLLEGIEAGRWHRILHAKFLRRSEAFSIALVRTEEDCGDEFSGYYISGQAPAYSPSFAEESTLSYSKLVFQFSHETHLFKLGTENTAVNLKDFPSCKTAREEMQHWSRLTR